MGWDSNPRGTCAPAGFQDRCLKPLGHPSNKLISIVVFPIRSGRKRALLPKLLPNLSAGGRYPRYSRPKRSVDLGGGIFLHSLGDVRVQVERRRDRRVTEPLLRDLRMNAGEQELCRMTMPKIVEPRPRQILGPGHQMREFMGQAARLHRLAISARANQRLAILADAEREQFLGLLTLKAAQLIESQRQAGE